jgi:hypothetical protein
MLKFWNSSVFPVALWEGKCGWREGADGASPSKIVMGLGERSRLGWAQGAGVTEIKNDPVGFAEWLKPMFLAWDLCGLEQELW